MKRKFVLRLLATVMAATLVVTGVPGTALTGIAVETVYAETQLGETLLITDNAVTVKTTVKSDIYAIVKTAEYDAAKLSTYDWKTAADTNGLTFGNLDPATAYSVLHFAAANASAKDVANLGKDDITTKTISIATATVELEQDTYEYSTSAITPKVKSITINKTKISGSEFERLFTVSQINANTAVGTTTFHVSANAQAVGQIYGGDTADVTVTISKRDISKDSKAYITIDGKTPADGIADVEWAAAGAEPTIALYTEGSSTPVSKSNNYYIRYDNNTSVGTATVTVVGTGTTYTGSISQTFNVVKQSTGVSNPGAAPTLTSTTTSITASYATATTKYEFAISEEEKPQSLTWVAGAENNKCTFTSCNGAALKSDTTYYVWGRCAETENTVASGAYATARNIKLAKGDLANASISLDHDSFTYTGSEQLAVPTVTLGGVNLSPDTDYKVSYIYLDDDGNYDAAKAIASDSTSSNSFVNAGKIVVIVTGVAGKYSGSITKTYEIKKVALTATIKSAKAAGADTKPYDGKATVTLEGATVTYSAAGEGSDALPTDGSTTKDVVVTLNGKDAGSSYTVKSVDKVGDNAFDAKLKNYDVTYTYYASDGSTELKVAITKAQTVTITASSPATANFGKTTDLGATNNAGLKMTYTVPEKWQEYISVSEDGKVNVKKYDANAKPVVVVSVEKTSTTNYDSTQTADKEIAITLAKSLNTTIKMQGGTSNVAFDIRPEETAANVIKKIAATIEYDSDTAGTPHTITIDGTNATFEYSLNNTDYSTTWPKELDATTNNKVYVKFTYTGTEASSLGSATAPTVTLTVKDDAAALPKAEVATSAAPTITGPTEAFEGAATVTITAADGAVIYYTTDGKEPTTAGQKYSNTVSIAITDTTTVKAIAVEDGKDASAVKTAVFTKKDTTAGNGNAEDSKTYTEAELAAAKTQAAEAAKKEATDAANKAAETAQAAAVEAAKKEATEAAEKAAAEKIAAAEAAQKAAEEKAAAATTATTKVGDTVKVDGNTYKVTSVAKKTVSFYKVKKNATSAYIVSSVAINGVTYKVTSIAKNAFKGDKKLTSVTIPATVKTIGANAFNGCSKLKTITINSSKITKIGSKAFSGVSKKAVVKAPSKKVAAYKKLLKKAKFTGSVKKA